MKNEASGMKRAAPTIALIFLLLLLSVNARAAIDMSKYRSNPAFLPGIVSPNILFLIDAGWTSLQPAYGWCEENLVACKNNFLYYRDDYDPSVPYYGYYDNGRSDLTDPPDLLKEPYSDVKAWKYNCPIKGQCVKSTTGKWNGNWLNWLTMTQFDVMKKVFVGGYSTQGPDAAKPSTIKLQSILMPLDDNGVIYKAVKTANCTGRALNCDDTKPQPVKYTWIDTPAGATTIFSPGEWVDDQVRVYTAGIPFAFTLFDNNYAAGSPVYVSSNGVVSLNSSLGSYYANADFPVNNYPGYIAPYWDDLYVDGGIKSSVSVFTVGKAPRRIFVVSFEKLRHLGDWSPYDPFNFQVLFFEGGKEILFQYKNVEVAGGKAFGKGSWATIGINKGTDLVAKKHSYNSAAVSNGMGLHNTPGSLVYEVRPVGQNSGGTYFKIVPPALNNADIYQVEINASQINGACFESAGNYLVKSDITAKGLCYDHMVEGILHQFRQSQLGGTLAFRLAVMLAGVSNGATDGGNIAQRGRHFNGSDAQGVINDIRKATVFEQNDVKQSPLAEALYETVRYFKQVTPAFDSNAYNVDTGCSANSPDPYCFGSNGVKAACCKSFVLLISPGKYTHDFARSVFNRITTINDEGTPAMPANGYAMATDDKNAMGAWDSEGWLDNVAYNAHVTDLRSDLEEDQNITLYTVNTYGGYSSIGRRVLEKAAMWGGFEDKDGNGKPSHPSEYDKNDDGTADTYFEPGKGASLKDQILEAVQAILKNSASGTSVSVLSTSSSGQGGIYQAYFYPARIEGTADKVAWPGFMRSFFIDAKQYMRDDSGGGDYQPDPDRPGRHVFNGQPDGRLDMDKDRLLEMQLQSKTNEVKIALAEGRDGDAVDFLDPGLTRINIDDVVSVWEAGDKLAKKDKNSRKIYTWVDKNNDGKIPDANRDMDDSPSGEMLFFKASTDAGSFGSLSNHGAQYLRAADPDGVRTELTVIDEADAIIEFTRGHQPRKFVNISGVLTAKINYRSRCVTIPGVTGAQPAGSRFPEGDVCVDNQWVWALGDIVNATPTLVSAPQEVYDAIYGRKDYRDFRKQYIHRRNMVYVGANDGQLHAFNAGFFDPVNIKFCKGPGTSKDGSITGNSYRVGECAGDADSPDLGEEMWSFVPYDLLPHLAWLACNGTAGDPTACGDLEYTHVFYMDKRPKATDVRIFPATGDPIHPNGWGTILIVGMGWGGGEMVMTENFNGTGNETRKFASAYYVFDVTEPEKPRFLKRLYHPDLEFTTSYPAIVRVGTDKKTPLEDEVAKWFVVVGNGPTNDSPTGTPEGVRDYAGQVTRKRGKLFVFDLALDKQYPDGVYTKDTGVDNIYFGDPTPIDQDLNYTVDVVYVGAVDTTNGDAKINPRVTGQIWRLNTFNLDNPDYWSLNPLYIDPTMGPLLTSPAAVSDGQNLWVLFGTGKLANDMDKKDANLQRFYSIRDACWEDLNQSSTDRCGTAGQKPSGLPGKPYTYIPSDLFDSTHIEVTVGAGDNQVVAPPNSVCGTTTKCSYDKMLENINDPTIVNKRGWYHDMRTPPDFTTVENPSERILSRAVVVGGVALFTSYRPTSDVCTVLGSSRLWGLHYKSGTAYKLPILNSYKSMTGETAGQDISSKTMELKQGLPTAVGVIVGPDSVTGYVQKSTGEIFRVEFKEDFSFRGGPSSWIEKDKGGGTVEIEEIYRSIP